MSLKGKVTMVTGGSRGIGRAIALEFARRGADVAFNYFRSHEAAAATQRQIETMGVNCIRIKAHLGDSDRIKEMFSKVNKEFGRVDVLVNNAASGINRPIAQLEERHWDWTLDINAKAAWLCSMEASKLMADGSSIVNISSMGSQRVLPNYFLVGTSKAALEALTRYLAVEMAGSGINVNAVSGGYVMTEALKHFPNSEEMVARAENRTLTGHRLEPLDIARVVAFLCTEDARMIRGQVLVVDGGSTLKV